MQAAHSLGKYFLHSGRETGVAAEHMGTSSGLKAYGLFSHCHVLNHFEHRAKLRRSKYMLNQKKLVV